MEDSKERTGHPRVGQYELSPRHDDTDQVCLPASYGHGVLRDPDPRFTALQQFCDVRPELKDSPIIQLVKKVSLLCHDGLHLFFA